MLHIDIKSKGKACLLWIERNTNRRELLIEAFLQSFCDFPLLNRKFCILKLESQHMQVDGFLELSHFSPEGLSDFSISGELGDKSVLAVDQKASREKTGRSEGKC